VSDVSAGVYFGRGQTMLLDRRRIRRQTRREPAARAAPRWLDQIPHAAHDSGILPAQTGDEAIAWSS
jgi:hypothetical protein